MRSTRRGRAWPAVAATRTLLPPAAGRLLRGLCSERGLEWRCADTRPSSLLLRPPGAVDGVVASYYSPPRADGRGSPNFRSGAAGAAIALRQGKSNLIAENIYLFERFLGFVKLENAGEDLIVETPAPKPYFSTSGPMGQRRSQQKYTFCYIYQIVDFVESDLGRMPQGVCFFLVSLCSRNEVERSLIRSGRRAGSESVALRQAPPPYGTDAATELCERCTYPLRPITSHKGSCGSISEPGGAHPTSRFRRSRADWALLTPRSCGTKRVR